MEAGGVERRRHVRRRTIPAARAIRTSSSGSRAGGGGTASGDRRGGRRAHASKGGIPWELSAASAAGTSAGNKALQPDFRDGGRHPRIAAAGTGADGRRAGIRRRTPIGGTKRLRRANPEGALAHASRRRPLLARSPRWGSETPDVDGTRHVTASAGGTGRCHGGPNSRRAGGSSGTRGRLPAGLRRGRGIRSPSVADISPGQTASGPPHAREGRPGWRKSMSACRCRPRCGHRVTSRECAGAR